jgi:hypothetical protein
MERLIFDFNQEPQGDLLKSLLVGSAELATTCGLIVQGDFPATQSASRLAAGLSPYAKDPKKVSSWPGTQLHDEGNAIQYQYVFSQPVAHLLFEAADHLYGWVSPDLPEDLHLLRQDGSVLLGSVAHEHDAWLEMGEDEFTRLTISVPGLDKVVTERKRDQ